MTDEEIVAALAAVLDGEGATLRQSNRIALALLPVVRWVAEQRAAEELLAVGAAIGVKRDAIATDQNGYWVVIGTVGSLVLDRAAALTATPNHGRNATT